jgi:hypothetical protein
LTGADVVRAMTDLRARHAASGMKLGLKTFSNNWLKKLSTTKSSEDLRSI